MSGEADRAEISGAVDAKYAMISGPKVPRDWMFRAKWFNPATTCQRAMSAKA
jgi:hypothetical protein